MIDKIYKDLFVLDLANNHFGDLNHSKKIINLFARISRKKKLNTTIKFQLRDYNTYIHKNFIHSENKFVRRFLDTKLSLNNFKELFKYVKKNKLKTSCTPFDERSVDVIEKFKFDYLKIASVSGNDFTLLKRVVKNKIPKIISTGGLDISDIDKIVRLMKKYSQKFALMHCIAIYPSKDNQLQISFIKKMVARYKNIPIGWSTHEDPNSILPSSLALACGATMFERHIGINTKKYKLNKYSMTPEIFNNWSDNLINSRKILSNDQKKIEKEEIKTLNSLQRGVYAKENLKAGTMINTTNTYLAFPLQKNQLSVTDFQNFSKIKKDIKKDNIVEKKNLIFNSEINKDLKTWYYIHQVKGILNENNVNIGDKFEMEISHHNGIDNFNKVGCFLFNIINKDYTKKIIVMLPNQKHPSHSHKKKNESFFLMSGELTIKINRVEKKMKPGDIIDIGKNDWHEFRAGKEGCIIDEISTTSFIDDSFYKNKKFKKLERQQRKTIVKSWV